MSETGKGALVLTHIQSEGSCSLGTALFDRGARIKTLNIPRIDLNDIDPLRPDILVLMGGPIGVYQQEDYPFLKQEIEIVRKRLEADKPTIGVCLGAQIIAAAMGADVYPGDNGSEIGWNPINITDEGLETPARHLDQAHTNMFHWHGDTFDLPEGATLLASSDQYQNQIFERGNTLGLQCHPEVRENQLQEWFVMFTSQITGKNPHVKIGDLRSQTKNNIAALNRQANLFFNEWLNQRGL